MPSVAVIEKLAVPAVAGVPDSVPFGLSVNPAGNPPEVMAKVYGVWPPVAVTGWLYPLPTTAVGRVSGGRPIVTPAQISTIGRV